MIEISDNGLNMKMLYPDISNAKLTFKELNEIFTNSKWTRMTHNEYKVSGLLRFENLTSQNSYNRTTKWAAKSLWKSCLTPKAVTMTN